MTEGAGRIIVCPLAAVERVSAEDSPEALISLMSSPEPVHTPDGIDPDRHLRLTFNDIADVALEARGLVPPSEAHVAAIIGAARAWTQERPLLVHCWFGVSRSPAAAAIILAALRPDRHADEIADALRAAAPFATPNRRMVALGDAALGREGTFAAAIGRIGRGAECSEGTPFFLPLARTA